MQIGAVLQEGRHEGRAIIEPSSAGIFFCIFAITSRLSARIDSTFRAIGGHPVTRDSKNALSAGFIASFLLKPSTVGPY